MRIGIKHLIECHCTLKIYQKHERIIYHKFPVYSKYDEENGGIIEKIAQCNNCKTLHRVHDICKSEIVPGGKDEDKTMISIQDIIIQLPDKLSNFLVKQDCDITVFEQALDIIDSETWNEKIVISREIIDDQSHVKIIQILSENKFKIKKEVINNQFVIGV